MNKYLLNMKKVFLPLAVAICAASSANAAEFSLKDIFGTVSNAVQDGTLTDMIQGVLATSNITVADMAGEWTSSGSAVCFQSENLLNKAGGAVAATEIEKKINPYFDKYGLDGAVFTIQTDGSFTLKMKKISLSGTIAKNSDNKTFDFSFTALGGIKLATIPAYVQKTSKSMDIMFDADKLITLLNVIAKISGSKLASTAVNLLNSYDGLCVGFKLNQSGTVEGQKQSNSILDIFSGLGGSSSSTSTNTDSSKSGSNISTGTSNSKSNSSESPLDKLRGILGGKK